MEGFTVTGKILALVCLFQLCGALRPWNDLRVKYSATKDNGYYRIPFTTDSPLMRGYIKTKPEDDFNLPIDFYCFSDDPSACFMYDKKGRIAGVQTSFLKSDVSGVDKEEYDFSTNVNFKQTNFFNIPAYSVRVFFTNPEKLTPSGRRFVNETAEGLWVYLDGKLVEIPRYEPVQDRFGNFHKQGCVRSMGLHYFYKVDKNLKDCKDLFPLSVLYDEGRLIGYSVATVGKGNAGPSRDWYEHPKKQTRNSMVPNRSSCVDDLSGEYGLTSMHVYLVEEPWTISCTLFDRIMNRLQYWINLLSPF